jgi:hypothetical protein
MKFSALPLLFLFGLGVAAEPTIILCSDSTAANYSPQTSKLQGSVPFLSPGGKRE